MGNQKTNGKPGHTVGVGGYALARGIWGEASSPFGAAAGAITLTLVETAIEAQRRRGRELFFRAVLLPFILKMTPNRHVLGLTMHSAMFGLWHIGPLFIGASPTAVVAIMLVPFLGGLGWGWAVMRDRTVLWAMIQNSLIWVIDNQFAFNA